MAGHVPEKTMKRIKSRLLRLSITALVVCSSLAFTASAFAQQGPTLPPLPPPPSLFEQLLYALIALCLTILGK